MGNSKAKNNREKLILAWSWEKFGEGVCSIFDLNPPLVGFDFENVPTTASVRSSWQEVGKLMTDAYVKETGEY